MESLRVPVTSDYCLVVGRLFKLHPDFDEAVKNILLQNPTTFVIFIFESSVAWNRIAMQRLARSATGSDMMNRVRLGAYSKYFKLVRHASVILDTFPYGGDLILCMLYLLV